MTLDPRTPVLVGQGQVLQRIDDPEAALDPLQLMAQAVGRAASDAALTQIPTPDAMFAVRSLSTKHANPAQGVADLLGISPRRCGITPHGGNMPQTLVNLASREIQKGRLDLVILTGGEATRTRNRARKNNITLAWPTGDGEVLAPELVGEDLALNHEIELERKIVMPIQIYPMFETALRAASHRSVEDHQRHIGKLWSHFSAVAATNPNAWTQREYSTSEITTPSQDNRIIGFPYTKMMNSNNDVDMAAALIICSVERARSLGIPQDRWIFPHAGTDCHEHNYISHRHTFSETPAVRLGGALALQLADKHISDIGIIDLYSCFPSAVQLGAQSLGISLSQQLTRTGGLSFAGGPWNNYVMHAIATTMTELRDTPKETALVWANGGYATKHAFGVYATTPSKHGFRHDSPQAQIDALPRRNVATAIQAAGPATIESYSVMHDRNGSPETVCATALLTDGRRAWAISHEPALAEAMTHGEWVGKLTTLDALGTLHVEN
ncbi:MAG: acetyl-CoA acetyltransferase [Ilumatobacteraceae bacterium]